MIFTRPASASRVPVVPPAPGLGVSAALILALLATALVFLVERPVNLALLAGAGAGWALLTVPRRAWPWLLAALVATSWSLMLSQGLFYEGLPRTVALQLVPGRWLPFGAPEGWVLYREGLVYGLVQSLRAHMGLLVAAALLSRYGIEELARGLRSLGVPAPIALLGVMAVRQVPLLADEVRSVWIALRLKGAGAAGALRLACMPVLASHLRRADETAAALWSRGLGNAAPRARPLTPIERLSVWVIGATAAPLAVAVGITWLHGQGWIEGSPWEAVSAWVRAYV
jgi:energy-coupling factor transport system permease protein